eukprot:6149260-Ditylum_brightwellii.AAC.2
MTVQDGSSICTTMIAQDSSIGRDKLKRILVQDDSSMWTVEGMTAQYSSSIHLDTDTVTWNIVTAQDGSSMDGNTMTKLKGKDLE